MAWKRQLWIFRWTKLHKLLSPISEPGFFSNCTGEDRVLLGTGVNAKVVYATGLLLETVLQ
jgi:hypothetical protein